MKFRFTIKPSKKATSPVTIYVRTWESNRFDAYCTTPLKVLPDHWNAKAEKVRNLVEAETKDKINTALDNLRNELYNQYNMAVIDQIQPNRAWVENVISNFFGGVNARKQSPEKIYFTDWVQLFVDNAPFRLSKGKPIQLQTVKNYKSTLSKLMEFEKHNAQKIKHSDVGLRFYNDFVHFCREVDGLNDNTIGSIIGRIKIFCKYIELDGLPINQQYKHPDFMGMTSETQDIYLTLEEIEQIKNIHIQSEALQNARNWLVIGCWTGLRVSDLLKLTKANFVDNTIKVVTIKTKTPISIPMHAQVREMIDRVGLPYRISDQKFNDHIKQVCKLAGIDNKVKGAKINPTTKRKETGIFHKWELVTSHICRRSFATNMYFGGLHISTVMAITGHKQESVFLKYIKVTNAEHTAVMQKYFDNMEAVKTPKNTVNVVTFK